MSTIVMPKTLVLKTKHDWEAAYLVYLGDATLQEISDMFEIPYETVVRYSREHYWGGRRANAKRRGLSVTAQQLKSRMERTRTKHLNHMLNQIEDTQEHIEELEVKKPGLDDDDKTKVSLGHKLSLIEQHDRIARKTLGLDEDNQADPVRDGYNFLVGMAKAAKSLGNENEQLALPDGGETITDVDAEIRPEGGESEAKHTSSAYMVLPEDSDVNTGILGPFNGHINGIGEVPNTPQSEEKHPTGALKPLPRKIITSR